MSVTFSFSIVCLRTFFENVKILLLRKFTEISIKIGDHFFEENDGLCSLDMMLGLQDLSFQKLDDMMTYFGQLLRDIISRPVESIQQRVLFLSFVLNGLNDFEFSSSRCHNTFVCRSTEVAFGRGKLLLTQQDLIREVDHFFEPMRVLLTKMGSKGYS